MLFSKELLLVVVVLFSFSCIVPSNGTANNLLTNYLPVSMQALQYYLDHLQYEPLSSTTIEPLFSTTVGLEDVMATPRSTAKPMTPTGSWQPSAGWWWTTTTTTTKPLTTRRHKPAIFAPEHSRRKQQQQLEKHHYYSTFHEILKHPQEFGDLTVSLMRDIQTESDPDHFNNDVEQLDNFMRLYDDNYGRVFSAAGSVATADHWSNTAGEKRVPPTKPYVDFLLVYDLLKRDAKAAHLSTSEGYSDELLGDLYKLSNISAARQLYTIFKRMLERGDIKRSDVVSRIKDIIKDLSDPESKTARALRFIPALKFLP